MSEHHHHHSHHKMDGASRFKYKSLSSLRRRKLLAKWLFRILILIGISLAVFVAVIYIL